MKDNLSEKLLYEVRMKSATQCCPMTYIKSIFGSLQRPAARSNAKERAQGLLRKFNISTPVSHPDNLYDGDLPFPRPNWKRHQ